jgi:hypothetical protein
VVAPLDSDPDRVLFATSAFDTAAQEWRQTWQVLSLADGNTVTTLDELVADAGLDGAATANRRLLLAEDETVVFGPEHGHVIDTATDGLLRLDLTTWTVVDHDTFHPSSTGTRRASCSSGSAATAACCAWASSSARAWAMPQSVEVDGVWVTDEALRRSVWGPTVGYTFGDSGARVASWDAIGSVRWTSESSLPSREGFSFSAQDDVVVYVACDELDGTSPCPDERLVGLDPDTGRERWSLPGWRIVGPVGDGVAYVTDSVDVMAGEQPSGWYVLDTTTGEVADTPTWPGVDTFLSECCGGYDYQHTDTLGGIVVVVSGQVMRVWFPAALTPPAPTQVALT